jgi:hypothetical protein
MSFKKRQKRFVAEFHRRHGSNSFDCRFGTLPHTMLNRTQPKLHDGK